MTLQERLIAHGATLAPDGIPQQFNDLASEYDAALNQAVLLVRSHEGRLAMTGRDRLALMHRISTNHLEALKPGEGAATIFTNANARIIDRAVVLSREDRALVLTEPGRGPVLENMLRRNIFFNDDARLENLGDSTVQFALHGPQADAIAAALLPTASSLPLFGNAEVEVAGASIVIARNKPLADAHWTVIAPVDSAAAVWDALLAEGEPFGLRPAGSLTYNTLRIRAGRPGVGRELSETYIPLEVGLWDEISFRKGCYTGQEIIARMESRNRLARVMVSLSLSAPVEAPADLLDGGKIIGRVTSSVTTPQGEHLGIAVIKTDSAMTGHRIAVVGSSAIATVTGYAAVPPPMVEPERG